MAAGDARLRRQLVLYSAFALLVAAAGLALVGSGDAYGVLALLLSAVLLTGSVGGIALALSRLRRRSDHFEEVTRDGSQGKVLFMPYSRAARGAWYLLYLAIFACFVSLPWVAYAAPDDGSRGYARLQVLSAVGLGAAVWAGVHLASYLIRRGRRMGVGIASDGVYHASWFGAVFYPWNLIERTAIHPHLTVVQLVLNQRGRSWAANPVSGEAGEGAFLRATLRRRLTRIPVGNLAVRPQLALSVLTLYLGHSELREELNTGAGLQRVRDMNVG